MKLLFLIIVMLLSSQLLAQEITGKVIDEQGMPLIGATVVTLSPADSSMISFGITDEKGRYTLYDVPTGDHILQVSFVSYATLYQKISVNTNSSVIDDISLAQQSEVLQEVTVKAEHIPMGVIGDTISYNAAAFKTKPGASVEDLLKKLPGVEVERDGSIKAMGKDVENVLVDGKEFFGSDPKMATKNLEAEAVDKVQVFDKKSELAEFTGVDDGVEEKTINLKLKEEYKSGGFGRAEGKGGIEERYSGKANYHRFSPTMQASVIVGANNINQEPFSFGEYISFMGGLGNALGGGSSFFGFEGLGSQSSTQGITDNISGGLNFNYDASSKLKLSSHYYISQNKNVLDQSGLQEKYTLSNSISTIDTTKSNSTQINHRAKIKLEYKPNPFVQIIWHNYLDLGKTDINNLGAARSYLNKSLLNENNYSTLSRANNIHYTGKINFRKKYKKKGRSWISTFDASLGHTDQSDSLRNSLYIDNVSQITNQTQILTQTDNHLVLSSTYTEPLGKHYISIAITANKNSESPARGYYDILTEQVYLNESLSSSFVKDERWLQPSLKIRRNGKKYQYNIGLKGQWSHQAVTQKTYTENLETRSSNRSTRFFLPYGNIDLDLTKSKSLEVGYSSSIALPQLRQLMPFVDNTNPAFIRMGNTDLRPEYEHRISLSFSDIDQFHFKSLFANLYYTRIKDKIIQARTIDERGIQTSMPINTKRMDQITGFASYSAPIRKWDIKYRINTRLTLRDYTTLLNNAESEVNNTIVNTTLSISNRNTENIDVAIGIQLENEWTRYALDNDFDQTFINYKTFIDAAFYPTEDWTVSIAYDHHKYNGSFFNQSITYNMLRASIEKTFQEGLWTVSINAFDLLNQNLGLDRRGTSAGLTEQNYNTLGRYFLLGVSRKIGKKKKNQGLEINF